MEELICGSCAACCKWGDDNSIRPVLLPHEVERYKYSETERGLFVLQSDANGNCVYLTDNSCSIYDKRPDQCRGFDCRTLFDQMKDKTFIKVLIKGKEKS